MRQVLRGQVRTALPDAGDLLSFAADRIFRSIVVDAVSALGFLDREGDRYQNAPVAQAFLSGRGASDMRLSCAFSIA